MSAPPSTAAMAALTRHTTMRCLYGTRPERRARWVVRCVLSDLCLSSETVADAELAVNELVTNARLHAPTPYELRIYVSTAEVKIAVMDGGADHAALAALLAQTPVGEGSCHESGRGLQVVTGLFAGACGAEPASTLMGSPAKQVWVRMPRSAAHSLLATRGTGRPRLGAARPEPSAVSTCA